MSALQQRRPRIAIGSIFTESNHLIRQLTEYSAFEQTELLRGIEVLQDCEGAVRGMVEACRDADCETVPLMVASAFPGPPLSSTCYARLKDELLERLRATLPVNGLLLALHGSAAVEKIGDLEGDLIQSVRVIVGPDTPIVVSLDMHGHITPAMMTGANALVAWETYPHRDTKETGARAARLLIDTVTGQIRPVMAAAKVPLLASGIHGSTDGNGPMADLMREAKSFEGRGSILSISLFQVHPYLDLEDMGACAVVVTNGDQDEADRVSLLLAEKFWQMRERFAVTTFSPAEAVTLGMKAVGGPILLIETADCVGGGATGDSIAALRALIEAQPAELSLASVVDPEAAQKCCAAGAGATVSIEIGHKMDAFWGTPLRVTAEVVSVTDGQFRYGIGGVWSGKEASMGKTALLRVGGVHILVCSRGTYDWADEQFQSLGMSAAEAKFVVVKNPMNYRLAFAGIAKEFFVLDTPGPTPATLEHIAYSHMRGPFYPQHQDLAGILPHLVR